MYFFINHCHRLGEKTGSGQARQRLRFDKVYSWLSSLYECHWVASMSYSDHIKFFFYFYFLVFSQDFNEKITKTHQVLKTQSQLKCPRWLCQESNAAGALQRRHLRILEGIYTMTTPHLHRPDSEFIYKAHTDQSLPNLDLSKWQTQWWLFSSLKRICC